MLPQKHLLHNLQTHVCWSFLPQPERKSGEALKNNLIQEVMQIQYNVVDHASNHALLMSLCKVTVANQVCNRCTELQSVCDECKDAGQDSCHPSLRACHSCLENIQ